MSALLKSVTGIVSGAAALLTAALASDFEAVCVERTPELHPYIDDVEGACACVAQTAGDDILDEIQNAGSPDDLGDEAKGAMQSCGFNV